MRKPAPREPESRLKRTAKAVPWATLARGGVIVGGRWAALSAKERTRLIELTRTSRGRLANLSARERAELARLARKLDLARMGRELSLLAGKRRHGRRRHR